MMPDRKNYPVIGTIPQEYVPWGMLAPHENRARLNHAQSLSRLAERGGLDWGEILAILEDRPWRTISFNNKAENRAKVMEYVSAYLKMEAGA